MSALRFSFGVFTDCQFCERPSENPAKSFRAGRGRLAEAVASFNERDLAFVMNLGDLIDCDWKSYEEVLPVVGELWMPVYHTLGNHDFYVLNHEKPRVPGRLGLPSRYYAFRNEGWRFVVLDSTDLSIFGHGEETGELRASLAWYHARGLEAPFWNGGLGTAQLAWLDAELGAAEAAGERVIVCCHMPAAPEMREMLWNAGEALEALDRHNCVAAWFAGHHHPGAYALRNGVHHLTFKGMVEHSENCWATVRVYEDRLEVSGFGAEEDRVLKL